MTTKSKVSSPNAGKLEPSEKAVLQFSQVERKGDIAPYNPLSRSMFFYPHKDVGMMRLPQKRGKIF
jgi:hypothetical protein